jgi:hypothetical protein
VKQVLERMKAEKLQINLKKCTFLQEELVYLGFIVSKEGLKMDPKKVKTIVDWPMPRCTFDVRSFHGLASFYQNLLETLVGFVHHLMLRKSTLFMIWNSMPLFKS